MQMHNFGKLDGDRAAFIPNCPHEYSSFAGQRALHNSEFHGA